MTKTISDTKVKHTISLLILILKISFLTLFGCGFKIYQINPLLFIVYKFINPTNECGVKYPPDTHSILSMGIYLLCVVSD